MKINEEGLRKLKASMANMALLLSIFSAVSLVFITMTVPTASAETIYVPDNYTTIQEAIDNADPGDIVYVRAGTYNETIIIPSTKHNITLQGESKDNTTIDAQGTDTVIEISASWVKVTGFT
jgi:pectin methylesterase-like acyl-CoA thioesterase